MNLGPLPGFTPIHQKNVSRQTEHPRLNRILRIVRGSRAVHLKKRFLKQIVGNFGAAYQMKQVPAYSGRELSVHLLEGL
jgi:hypothetical protein